MTDPLSDFIDELVTLQQQRRTRNNEREAEIQKRFEDKVEANRKLITKANDFEIESTLYQLITALKTARIETNHSSLHRTFVFNEGGLETERLWDWSSKSVPQKNTLIFNPNNIYQAQIYGIYWMHIVHSDQNHKDYNGHHSPLLYCVRLALTHQGFYLANTELTWVRDEYLHNHEKWPLVKQTEPTSIVSTEDLQQKLIQHTKEALQLAKVI